MTDPNDPNPGKPTPNPYGDKPSPNPSGGKPTTDLPGPSDREGAVELLNPQTFLRNFPDLFTQIYGEFGKTVKLLGGTPIIIHEYILVDDEPKLRFMNQKGRYQLKVITSELIDPVVTVKRYTFCGGKALVLLTSESPLDSLYALPLKKRIQAVSLDGHESGIIKPGGTAPAGKGQDGNTNTSGKGQDGDSSTSGEDTSISGRNTNTSGSGQDGNTNTSGKGQGYSNCMGYSRPGQTLSGTPHMNQEDLVKKDSCLKVAVLDSGISFKNGKLFDPGNDRVPCRDVSAGWDFVEDDNRPDDTQTNRHGTRVANVIRLVCPEATIIPVRISNEQNRCTLYDVLCGLEYAAQQGARIINASWVFPTDKGIYIPLLQASLRRLAYRGILVVCASGNVGNLKPDELDRVPHIGERIKKWRVPMQWPACSSVDLENIISVTAIGFVPDGSATRRVVCELRSNRYISVGVVANGRDQIGEFGSFITPDLNDFRGTSFAAPYVTGHIAKAMHCGADLSSRAAVLKAIGAVRDKDLKKQISGGMWIDAR